MSSIKKLASQTAIYGISTIVAKLINYLLMPYLTRIFGPAEYGINAEFFTYCSLLNILFTYGMETAYFRFASNEPDKEKVFDTAFLSIVLTTFIFSGLLFVFAQPIAVWLQYPDKPHYVQWFSLILAFDTLCAIPYARLRIENKPLRYASIKTAGILVNVFLVVFFTGVCPYILNHEGFASLKPFVVKIFDPTIGIGYTFLANVGASAFPFLLFTPFLLLRKYQPDRSLLSKMLPYALPLVIVGTAGMINETFDRYLLKVLLPLPLHERLAQLGIYSACYKVSIIMTLFVQAYKTAAEPFFFSYANKENPQQIYAKSMKYFVIVCSVIFLGVMLFLDIIQVLVGKPFRIGLHIVPILLLANLCIGVYYNLSIWYRLTDKTRTGSLIAIIGALITIGLNYWWIPIFGYTGSAWATFICYSSMMIMSYIWGQQYYPVPYQIGRMALYLAGALFLWAVYSYVSKLMPGSMVLDISIKCAILLLYVGIVYLIERPKK